ncbi:MAG TPA: type I secretion protein TolC, partial [Piscirickettsiaceae bacterium]|nr:type I secretion protein TolC [Piscirickettsiaceae bacterium]
EKVGLAANTDVLQARSAYDLSRADRIKAENGLNIAYENLAKLTGQRITALKSIGVDSALPPVQSNEAQWLQRALENNLQLKIAAYQVTQARLNVALNKGDYLPTLALTAALTDTAYEGYDRRYASTFTDNRNRQVALQLNWPIYSGGLTRATVEQARYQVNKALAAERDLRESTALQVRVLVDNLRNGMALVEALRAAVVSSQAFLQAAEESHRVGLKSMLDVLSARANAHKAQRDLIAALNDLVINRINLEAVAGDLNEADLARIESLLVAGDGPP